MSDETLRLLALMDDAVAEILQNTQRVSEALNSIRDIEVTERVASGAATD